MSISAGEVGRLYVRFDADGKPYIKGLRDLEQQTDRTGSRMEASLARYGKRAALVVAVAMTAMVVATVKAASSFEYEMSRIRANAEATDAQMESLRQTVLQLGKDTVFSANETAQAANELVKAGMSVGDTIQALPGMLALASAGELDVAQAATITSDALNVFKLKASDASVVADTLALTANKSTTEVAALGEAFEAGASAAVLGGMSIQEFNAVLAILAQYGVKGAEAGTMVKTMFMQVMAPSSVARDLMDQWSISVYDANGEMKSMADILRNLETSLAGATEEERNFVLGTVFGTRGITVINDLLAEGSDRYVQWTEDISKAGAAEDIAATKLDNLAGSWEQLKGSLETAAITMGTQGLGGLRSILDDLTEQTNQLVDDWEALTGTDAWREGGFEVRLSMASDTIMDAFDRLLDSAGDALEGVDWSSIGATLGKSVGRFAGDAITFAVGTVTPMLVDLGVGIVNRLAQDLPSIVAKIVVAQAQAGPGIVKSLAVGAGLGIINATTLGMFNEGMPGGVKFREETPYNANVSGWEGWRLNEEAAAKAATIGPADQAALDAKFGAEEANQIRDALAAAGTSTGKLAEYTKTLQAAFTAIVDPAAAWEKALSNQGGKAKNAQRAVQDYIAELDKQILAWSGFEADLKKLASELGPEVGAEAIMSAAGQGPQFVHALVGADPATSEAALRGLLLALDNNLAGLSPEIAALCEPAGENAAQGLVVGMQAGLEAGKTTIQDATKSAAAVDLFGVGAGAAASFKVGFVDFTKKNPISYKPAGGLGFGGILHDSGGYLPPGISVSVNKTGRPEPVLTPASADKLLNIGPVIDQLSESVTSLGQNLSQAGSSNGGGGNTIIQVLDTSSVEKAREHGGRFARV